MYWYIYMYGHVLNCLCFHFLLFASTLYICLGSFFLSSITLFVFSPITCMFINFIFILLSIKSAQCKGKTLNTLNSSLPVIPTFVKCVMHINVYIIYCMCTEQGVQRNVYSVIIIIVKHTHSLLTLITINN